MLVEEYPSNLSVRWWNLRPFELCKLGTLLASFGEACDLESVEPSAPLLPRVHASGGECLHRNIGS